MIDWEGDTTSNKIQDAIRTFFDGSVGRIPNTIYGQLHRLNANPNLIGVVAVFEPCPFLAQMGSYLAFTRLWRPEEASDD